MKRCLLGLVAVVGLGLVAAPAHADKPDCYTVADLPGECLSYEAFALIDNLQHQNRSLSILLDHAWTVALQEKEDANNTHALLADMTVQRDAAQAQRDTVLAERDAALAKLDRRATRILVLRAKVQTLRAVVRTFV